MPHIVAMATIQGRRLFRSELLIVRLLFEGGDYSRAASIRRSMVYYYFASVYLQLQHKLIYIGLWAEFWQQSIAGNVSSEVSHNITLPGFPKFFCGEISHFMVAAKSA